MSARVSNVWTYSVTFKNPRGWSSGVVHAAYPIRNLNDAEAHAKVVANRLGVEFVEVGPYLTLSMPGQETHIPAAPEATPERVARLRTVGHAGPEVQR